MTGAYRTRKGETGSALLIVFVFAAIVAITLFTEMPIVVFEAKRQKEQLLIDRGNEYAHAVRLFVRANRGQYPANVEALENTNRIRYLRNRYKDPFTGKDDWRFLHAGPNGLIIDSKVQKAPVAGLGLNNPGVANATGGNNGMGATAGGRDASLSSSISAGANASFGSFSSGGQTATGASNQSGGFFGSGNNSNNAAGGGRNAGQSSFGGFFSQPSSTSATGASTTTGTATTGTDGQTANANRPDNPFSVEAQRAPTAVASGNPAAATGSSPESDTAAGREVGGITDGGSGSGQSGPYIPRSRRPTSAERAANAGQTDATAAEGSGGSDASPINSGSGSGGFGQLAGRAPTGGTGAPGGFGSGSPGAFNQSSQFGRIQNPNLAGVASKANGLSIKIVNEQEKYSLWEFFYDPTKDPMRGAMGIQGGGANGQNAGRNNSNSGFGNGQNSGFGGGQNSGFGSGGSSGGFGGGNRSFGNNSPGNNTMGTGSQAPPNSPSPQTMTTSSYPR